MLLIEVLVMTGILASQHTHIIAKDYGIDDRAELGGRRQISTTGQNFIILANRELNTAILIKYDEDDLIFP